MYNSSLLNPCPFQTSPCPCNSTCTIYLRVNEIVKRAARFKRGGKKKRNFLVPPELGLLYWDMPQGNKEAKGFRALIVGILSGEDWGLPVPSGEDYGCLDLVHDQTKRLEYIDCWKQMLELLTRKQLIQHWVTWYNLSFCCYKLSQKYM